MVKLSIIRAGSLSDFGYRIGFLLWSVPGKILNSGAYHRQGEILHLRSLEGE
jgi:hypothetical protein